ncbi:MAG TPA: serine hydrolase, partial [Candidatus Paceibacterota bacterium]|nr:serine hydrolase [Candidatus Paceibacterota bacterium]
ADGTLDAAKVNLSQELRAHVDGLRKKGEIAEMGVYVRDLNNGPTFGMNENEGFLPASLLKLPVAMAFYKIAEDDPSVLSRKIRFEKRSGPPVDGDMQFIVPSKEIEPGREYRIDELVEAALVHSDNQAIQLLYNELNRTSAKPLRDLYRLLGVDESVLNGPGGSLSVKQYSAFFRILFNASFLDRTHSELILAMLARSEYDRALVAGVPEGVSVSHKFGESGTLEERQIHDCGIIYYPDHPYLLCVMSRGAEAEKLETSIASVAAFLSGRLASAE